MSDLTKIFNVDSRRPHPASSLRLNKVIQFLGDKLVVQEAVAVVGAVGSVKISVWDFRNESKVDLKPVRQVSEKPDSDEPLLEVKPLQIVHFSQQQLETSAKDLNENESGGLETRTVASFCDFFKLD